MPTTETLENYPWVTALHENYKKVGVKGHM